MFLLGGGASRLYADHEGLDNLHFIGASFSRFHPGSGRLAAGSRNIFPHSRQAALDRGVINPQAGHILCDAYPAI
jgi:hypothetical protein